jgi:hypothetical protein
MRSRTEKLAALAAALVLVGLIVAGAVVSCARESTASLSAEEATWTTYTNAKLGYTLAYPDALAPYERGPEVLFRAPGPLPFRTRFTGAVPVLVRWEDEAEGRSRGAWFGSEPAGEITLGGVAGERYVYVHHDGPTSDPTVAYVIPFRGKFLALEFRTAGDLDPVQQRILESFRVG